MTKREDLEAALARAEAVLYKAVTNAAEVDLDRTEADANLDNARAYCRQLRAALLKLDRSES